MKQAKVLSKAEISRVLAVIDAGNHSARNKIAFHLTHLAGMRVKEVSALKVHDVYDAKGTVRDELTLAATQTKGSKARSVVVSRKLQRELKKYFPSLPSHDPTFPLIYSAAGIMGASSHSGRRTFITNLASRGVGAKVLMHLAGHRHLSTTQRYIEVNDKMLRDAVNSI
jgi:integrase/recombinase XerD